MSGDGEGQVTLESLRTKVYEAIGAASVCWEDMSGTGVFQDSQAAAIASGLMADIMRFAEVFAEIALVPGDQMIQTMQAQRQIRRWAVSKGWRGEGVPMVVACDAEGVPLLNAKPRPARTFGDEIALITSELSEAIEAYRDNPDVTKVSYTVEFRPDQRIPLEALPLIDRLQNSYEGDGMWATANPLTPEEWKALAACGIAKPEGVPTELADAVIRILETCQEYGINLGEQIEDKMRYNETRAFRHGGRHL